MRNAFCFIACTNAPVRMEECRRYIEGLEIPEGFEVEVIAIPDALSMCEGYDRAMRQSDAMYKVYLHQDVFILNRLFLRNLLSIFSSDPRIGLVGMVGAPVLDPSGIMWCGERVGSAYEPSDSPYEMEEWTEVSTLHDVSCIDGFLMATSADIPWREDLFDGFDFYDVSQSFEFRKAGYRVVVPEQSFAWCVHDDGKILSLYNYNRYRKVFLEHYQV